MSPHEPQVSPNLLVILAVAALDEAMERQGVHLQSRPALRRAFLELLDAKVAPLVTAAEGDEE